MRVVADEKEIIKLVAVGDVILGEHFVCIGHGVYSTMKKRGVKYPFERISSVLQKADITFGNLETVLSDKGVKKRSLVSTQMRGMPSAVRGLTYAGFNVMSVANNHIMQHGTDAFVETVDVLNQHGIKYAGFRQDDGGSNEAIVVIKGIKVGFFAYSFEHERFHQGIPMYSVGDFAVIKQDIAKLQPKVDIVVISLHWGDEFIHWPSPKQIMLGRQIIDAGADIILGHHPHIVQGIERYKNSIIAYSLGNFVSDMWQEHTRQTILLQLRLSRKGIVETEIIPALINESYQPEILEGSSAEEFKRFVNELSLAIEAEDLSDFEAKMSAYLAKVHEKPKQWRREAYCYFLRNLHRYPPRMIWGNLSQSVKRKVKRLWFRIESLAGTSYKLVYLK